MPELKFDYNNKDYELIASQEQINTSFLGEQSSNLDTYVRMSVYTITGDGRELGRILDYDDANGTPKQAIFYSTLNPNTLEINTSPFIDKLDAITVRPIGGDSNDFKIYEASNGGIYVKPNEVFNQYDLPQGNYTIEIDILKQVKPTNVTEEYLSTSPSVTMPNYFSEYDYNDDGSLNPLDIDNWINVGRPDIARQLTGIIAGDIPTPPEYVEQSGNTGGGGTGGNIDAETNIQPLSSEDYALQTNFVGYHYGFIIKEISTSRKEVRLKLKDSDITKNHYIINDLKNILNRGTDSYSFKHFLNIGTGENIPIVNFEFDAITDGKDNQSIILRLYKPIPLTITNLKLVTIEEEILTTQTTNIVYFSDVEPSFAGGGLNPDPLENWLSTEDLEVEGFQNYNQLSGSLFETNFNQLTSGSSHYYPNLNTDFNEFENHTFFGSAKRKLENFKNKVETIQGYYSEISNSLSVSSSIDGDSNYIINNRINLFSKIEKEINSFTPYEHFLYYDGQSKSTSSAPGLGKNYADTIPVTTDYPNWHNDYVGEIIGGDGFNTVYHHSSKNMGGLNEFVSLFTDKYFVHNKPFFNYSGSIYLSFLMKGDRSSSLNWSNENSNANANQLTVPIPHDALYQNNILNPVMTGSQYQRYIFQASQSYWVPALNNGEQDFVNLQPTDFSKNSDTITILSGSSKTGSYQIKDSSNKYPTTVVSHSGVFFKGACMPAGELFRISYENTLSSSLQGYMNFDLQTSGSDVTDDMMLLTSFQASGTLDNPGPASPAISPLSSVTIADGVEVHGRNYGQSVQFVSESRHELDFDDEKFNFGRDDNFSLSIWAKRFHPNTGSADAAQHGGSGSSNIFGRGSTSISYGITYDQSTNKVRAGVRGPIPFGGSGNTSNTVTHTMTDDLLDWHHIVFTYESGSTTGIKLYIDGDLKTSKTTTGTFNITGSYDFTASNYSTEPLTVGGNEIVGGNNVFYSGFLQYPRVYNRTITTDEVKQLYFTPPGNTDSKITDVRVSLNNPTDVLPFDNLYHTSSTNWTNWYDRLYDLASTFDTNNIHSLENNLPTYIQESSEYDDLKDFLSLQGEQYDIIKNHIDGLTTLSSRGYEKTDSPPEELYPILLQNMGYTPINPFVGDLNESLSSYLSGVTSIDDIKNNTWRKTLNNLLYIYKSKGTQNSVRGLLNTYGYPPDVIPMQEFGGSTEDVINDLSVIDNTPPPPLVGNSQTDIDLNNMTSSVSFGITKAKLFNYIADSYNYSPGRKLNLDWWMDDATIESFQFVYKHKYSSQTQTILKSSGSGDETLWDLRLIPAAADNRVSSSFEFRLNNSKTGSLAIATNAVSMSTGFVPMKEGELWNVMLQRITSSISGAGIQDYKLHLSKQIFTNGQNGTLLGGTSMLYGNVSMSISGGVVGGTTTNGEKGFFANQNFQSSGSRHFESSSNLVVAEELSGSLSEIRAWNSALSFSRFRQHTLNKFSTIGNSIDSQQKELLYHFKLNENYNSSSVSSSNQSTVTIKDSAPKQILRTDYSFGINSDIATGSLLYGFDIINLVQFGVQNNEVLSSKNDNNIVINPLRGNGSTNLNPHSSPYRNEERSTFRTSDKLELDKSPTNFINTHILNSIDTFNVENYYGNPAYYYSSSYDEFDNLRNNFFNSNKIIVNSNKFIRSHENIFNQSISDGIAKLVPARSTLSDPRSGFGVTIKQNILERNKYQHKKYSVEINPNLASGSLNFVENTEYKQQSFIANIELPHTSSISLGNAYLESVDYINSPFLQPNGYTASIESPNLASIPMGSQILLSNSTLEKIHTSSISMGNAYVESVGYIHPSFLQPNGFTASLDLPISGTINYISINSNKSFVNIHDNYGTSSNDVHFLNYAARTGSSFESYPSIDKNYNVGHIDTRFVFQSIGDTEHYSSSLGFASNFTDSNRFDNRIYLSNNIHSSVTYDGKNFGTGSGIVSGRMMGKTRYFTTGSDGEMILPSNHVNNFANNFKDTMYAGTQNINPGFQSKTSMEDKAVDHSSASFYRIKVTGGENQIIVRGTGTSELDSDDKIIY